MNKTFTLILLAIGSTLFGCIWQTPYQSIADPSDKAVYHFFPQICVSENGDRMAIWQRDPSANYTTNELVYTHYDSLTGLWSPVQVSNALLPIEGLIDGDDNNLLTPPMNQTQADLCCFPNGDALVVWHQDAINPQTGTGPGIVASRYTVGSGWSSPADTLHNDAATAHPEIACFSNGTAVAVWSSPDNPRTDPFAGSDIHYSYYNGTSWSPQIAIDVGNRAGIPHICGDGTGVAVAVWVQWDDTIGISSLVSSTFIPPNTWTPQVVIANDILVAPYTPNAPGTFTNAGPRVDIDIACDPSGNAIVSWASSIDNLAKASVYDGGTGTWGPVTTISTNGLALPFSYPPSEISVCKGPEGDAHIAFRSLPPVGELIESVYYDSLTGTFTSFVHDFIDDTTTLAFSNPQVCCGPCNSASLIWAKSDLGTFTSDVNIASFDGQTKIWSPFQTIDTSDDISFQAPSQLQELRPNLTCDAAGSVYPIWQFGRTYQTSNPNQFISTTAGTCINAILPDSLRVSGARNRFPFQTECFCIISWQAYSCLSGIARYEIYKDGNLIAVTPGGTTAYKVPGTNCAGTYTVIPYNIVGLQMTSQSVTIN